MKYSATRNFKDGSVTKLSPYISRGVISTREVFDHVKTLGLTWFQVEKFVQELAWREFFQNVYQYKKDEIYFDINNPQENVENKGIPTAIINAETGIEVLDTAIKSLYETGYLHNHLRMYLASVTCNVAHFHWLNPAKWLYYHLLDGDLASNHLSWQWVAGTFSKKKYFANQENLNKYFGGTQQNTFLDVDYSEFENLSVPEILKSAEYLNLVTNLPNFDRPILKNEKTLIFNYYNLDYKWHAAENFQKILLLENSHFKKYPVSNNCVDFMLNLSNNITDLKIFVGEFEDLTSFISTENLFFKEHPTNEKYSGICEERDLLCSIKGDFLSFFSYWKKAKKELQKDFEMK